MQGSALSHICDVGPSPGVRQDGREWDDFRTLIVSNNAIGTSPASASVRLGNTFVLAGVSTHLTTPARETPTSGRVNVQVHVTPLASQTKHRSQAGDHAAILSHTLNSHFASGYVLDVGSLCVQEGQHCWDVQVDVCVLNDDGGVLDACTAATSSALRKLKLADMRIDPDTSKLAHHQVDGVEQYLSLQLLALPLAVTFGIVRDKLMCDPCHDEASQLASLIEVTVASGSKCCGVEFHSKSKMGQAVMQAAIQHAHARYSSVQANVM